MNVGFETIGNATIICHDNGPVLATDPWLSGSAYFGSWKLSHLIPDDQKESINNCEFLWISHGHPDHLSMRSLRDLKDKKILLPDHVGGRIETDMRDLGFKVVVLKDREWTNISPRINVMCIPDYNQDAVLLIDINGVLVADLNDAAPRGWGGLIRKTASQYKESFLLQLISYGDADMINFFDEDGNRIEPLAGLRLPVGETMSRTADIFGLKYVVPFSAMHKYQREDSVWANQYTTPFEAFEVGFKSKNAELLPPFISYDCETKNLEVIDAKPSSNKVLEASRFGDDWDEPLQADEIQQLQDYFGPISHLKKVMDFVNVRVGGKDNIIQFSDKKQDKGIIFEVPRTSLMKAINIEIFDDLLIGNFMKTTMVGKWTKSSLYPDFAPYVSKYSDNGRARSPEELEKYFAEYRKRAPVDYFRHRIQDTFASLARTRLDRRSPLFKGAKKAWWFANKFLGT